MPDDIYNSDDFCKLAERYENLRAENERLTALLKEVTSGAYIECTEGHLRSVESNGCPVCKTIERLTRERESFRVTMFGLNEALGYAITERDQLREQLAAAKKEATDGNTDTQA